MLNKVNDLIIRGKAKLITGAVAEALEGGCAPEDILLWQAAFLFAVWAHQSTNFEKVST